MPSKAIDYSAVSFYKICCLDPSIPDIYVGHTTNFTRRKHQHKSTCNTETGKGYNYYVYQFIRENGGWNNWTMLELCNRSCENKHDAELVERGYIEDLKASLNKQIPTRTMIEYYKDNREELREKHKKYHEYNREKRNEHSTKYWEEHREELREKQKKYYECHREERLEYNKKYTEDHREERNEKQKKYYEEQREERLKKQKKYHEEHREEIREKQKKYQQENKDKINERKRLARLAKKSSSGSI